MDDQQTFKIRWSSIDPARFIPFGENDVKTLSLVVIWIGVFPILTSAYTAHEVSQDILALLRQNGVEGAVVEWHEATPPKLAGPALMHIVGNNNITAYVRHIFTPALNMPLLRRMGRRKIIRVALLSTSMKEEISMETPAIGF